MKNLFYSSKEKTLFYISGYYCEDNVNNYIKYLVKNAEDLANLSQKKISDIYTYPINNSRRYKGMRVFYVRTEIIPENSFEISVNSDWTMGKWISD